MTLAELDEGRSASALECCGSSHWVAEMLTARPFRKSTRLEDGGHRNMVASHA